MTQEPYKKVRLEIEVIMEKHIKTNVELYKDKRENTSQTIYFLIIQCCNYSCTLWDMTTLV